MCVCVFFWGGGEFLVFVFGLEVWNEVVNVEECLRFSWDSRFLFEE